MNRLREENCYVECKYWHSNILCHFAFIFMANSFESISILLTRIHTRRRQSTPSSSFCAFNPIRFSSGVHCYSTTHLVWSTLLVNSLGTEFHKLKATLSLNSASWHLPNYYHCNHLQLPVYLQWDKQTQNSIQLFYLLSLSVVPFYT